MTFGIGGGSDILSGLARKSRTPLYCIAGYLGAVLFPCVTIVLKGKKTCSLLLFKVWGLQLGQRVFVHG